MTFDCTCCEKTYNQYQSLSKHMAKKHGLKYSSRESPVKMDEETLRTRVEKITQNQNRGVRRDRSEIGKKQSRSLVDNVNLEKNNEVPIWAKEHYIPPLLSPIVTPERPPDESELRSTLVLMPERDRKPCGCVGYILEDILPAASPRSHDLNNEEFEENQYFALSPPPVERRCNVATEVEDEAGVVTYSFIESPDVVVLADVLLAPPEQFADPPNFRPLRSKSPETPIVESKIWDYKGLCSIQKFGMNKVARQMYERVGIEPTSTEARSARDTLVGCGAGRKALTDILFTAMEKIDRHDHFKFQVEVEKILAPFYSDRPSLA